MNARADRGRADAAEALAAALEGGEPRGRALGRVPALPDRLPAAAGGAARDARAVGALPRLRHRVRDRRARAPGRAHRDAGGARAGLVDLLDLAERRPRLGRDLARRSATSPRGSARRSRRRRPARAAAAAASRAAAAAAAAAEAAAPGKSLRDVSVAAMLTRMTELPSGTVTFFFTDMAGSTAMLQRARAGGLRRGARRAPADRARRVRGARAASRSTSPATRSSSRSSARPTRWLAAQGVQDGLADSRTRVRIGLHTGEPLRHRPTASTSAWTSTAPRASPPPATAARCSSRR